MKGFTLIETIVYMALLGLIMTGALLSAFDLIASTQSSAGKTTAQEEGAFVGRKLEWALADMSATPVAGGSGCAQTLSIAKTGYGKNPVEFRRNTLNNTIEIREGGSVAYTALTTNNVSATCLTFTSIPAAGNAPSGVTAATTLDGFEFVNTQYVRK
jgi:prepilin-type N-terminal cleavage/methylation domain-containing protein